ncbi:potassium/proton antiporter [Idiomarina sp. PL1-037]|uniref:potassium/proton antiporter n=1 Tax=unclassified Idiomarina TaxID=2614829 RepID=UPI00294AB985|nr:MULTISPECIES: potassium/proton antiporter [unclassified Idiomarina]MDV6327312.1 potassium/proton antiporter [Idiomarina sp. Sol25]WQC52393.1 potassium/proton antiporter [Idiomarina sp. PL1-037]
MDSANTLILLCGLLLVVSILAAVASNRLGAPVLLTFLLIGMLAGEQGVLGVEFNNPDIAFFIGSAALVIILFDGGMRTHPERFRVALWPAISLATIGVALTCTMVASAAVYWFGLPWPAALLMGAILSSTDAAAVFGIFQSRGLQIKERVASTLEIESGSNDPMAVILTLTMTGAVASGSFPDWYWVGLDIVWQLIGGLTIGWLGGRLFIIAARKLPLSFSFFPLLAVACAISIYALTAKLHASGFLAVYLMGFVIGNARLPQLVHILQVQDGLAWLSQIAMFLILGLLVVPSHLVANAPVAIGIAFTLIFIARPLAVVISLLPFSFPWREQVFISWVGLRGAVPIILALFPWLSGVPDQELYFDIAFVVVMISLIIQGWSIAPVARWLGLEVPLKARPQQRMPLSSVPSKEALEVWLYRIDKHSPACDHTWKELKLTAPATFVGLIRDGEWLQPETQPMVEEGDGLLVAATVNDIDEVSRILASGGKGLKVSEKDFFGDFTLRGDLTLADVGSFYPLGNLDDALLSTTIADYFSQKFHRRVVIGDNIRLGDVILTVRKISDKGDIQSIGVKPVQS